MFSFPFVMSAQDGTISSTVSLGSSDLVTVGDSLPVNIQLLNFGTPGEKVDVTMNFIIQDHFDNIALQRTETVAVQTTASFTRYFQIPDTLDHGTYTLSLLVSYRDQQFPAISEQQFTVEHSILGYGLSKWYPAIPLVLLPFIFTLFVWRRKKKHNVENFDIVERKYDHISKNERTNYEIVHDIVESIHYRVGDKKINEVMDRIPGLTLNKKNLHVEEINGPMEEIIPMLIHEYEEITGKKANIITHPTYPKKRIQTH